MNRVESIKIGIAGIRGIVGKALTPEIAIHFSRAFATLLRQGRVAVGQDTRPSGSMFKKAVFSGLIYSGIQAIDVGILATPTLQIYVKERRLSGGIMVTASHNCEEWNGLKFIGPEGLFLLPHAAQNLIDLYHQEAFILPDQNQFAPIRVEAEAFRLHREKILGLVDVESIRRRKFRVLVDPGGGVGCLYDGPFLEALGCRVEMIHHEKPGTFPRPPEPTKENLTDASRAMERNTFDFGFAQDPDGDRLTLLDERGAPLGGDLTLAFALWGYLSSGRKGRIVVNLSTSRVVEEVAKRSGSDLSRAPVGEINVVDQMIREKAIAGGEGNGGVIIPEIHLCRDSFTGMALILDLMARSEKPLSHLASLFPRLELVTSKIPLPVSVSQRIVSLLKEEYPGADTRDGLRAEVGPCWFHIRPSNTEPVLRLVAEGPAGEVQELAARLESRIQALGG